VNTSYQLSNLLNQEGCNIFGFADLRQLPRETRHDYDYGIIIGAPYTKEAMEENKNRQPQRYYDEMQAINNRLTHLANLTADFLSEQGYRAYAKTKAAVSQEETNFHFNTILPYKTVATLAGIGWIGKTALLVTKEVGSALRLAAVLTNAPLECGIPIIKSKCPPNCMICVNICPGKAAKSKLWEAGMEREEFFDPDACYAAARASANVLLGKDETICGQCISHCPITMAGLGYIVD